MHAEYIRSLIVDSMAHMLESERRQTSWCGAVKARSSNDPSNHVDESGQYFDIGNRNYSIVLYMILTDLVSEHAWNSNTMGNLVEMLLARHWAADGSTDTSAMIALDTLCYCVYKYAFLLWRLDGDSAHIPYKAWIEKYVIAEVPLELTVGRLPSEFTAGAALAYRLPFGQRPSTSAFAGSADTTGAFSDASQLGGTFDASQLEGSSPKRHVIPLRIGSFNVGINQGMLDGKNGEST